MGERKLTGRVCSQLCLYMSEWTLPGAPKAEIQELPQVKNRLTFLYLERCTVTRKDSALKAASKEGYVLIPSNSFLVLMLGPGTSLSHRAAELIAEAGATVLWVSEGLTKLYGFGRPLTTRSALLLQQAKSVSSPRLHIEVVKRMYKIRFPDEDLNGFTLQQLRGREGSRVRKEYKKQSEKWGVEWNGRDYSPDDFDRSDPVNKALSIGNACLYGITAAVIYALGLSPGLGYIHVGHERSFIYDIADLYKAELTIPIAFEMAAMGDRNLSSRVRTAFRERAYKMSLIERLVKDISNVLALESEEICFEDTLFLWDGIRPSKEAGIQYCPFDTNGVG